MHTYKACTHKEFQRCVHVRHAYKALRIPKACVFCAISPSCSHSTVRRLSTHTAAVRAMHGCTRKYTQYQSVGIGGNVNADVRQHSRHEAPSAPCRYTDAPVSILIAPGAFLARVLFYCKRKNLLRNSTRLELFRVFSGLVPLLADIAHTLSYMHPSLVPVIHPSASHHTSPWNPSILTWEFNSGTQDWAA